ncbi:hypothetical protein IF188_13580 [Microbacterium sp. NEAU-LLC]|uniref:Uncharacterized protein n=1 Tax=Microbacterium helvum TaxID=2773713 RepID=A0ABR8NSL7_9MICO|nr:hypothetical protein [Microbacterium helvum]MBD3942727.1 hypothetical protein [Microbacterium helvum]
MISDDEQIARYAYALGNVPASVADKAYAVAFTLLDPALRQELVDELCAQLPVAPAVPVSDDPWAFAALMRDLHARAAIVGLSGAGAFAAAFVSSPPIVAYFTTGAGSVAIDDRPLWLQELVGHETAPIDGGRMHHRPGVNTGDWYVS